VLGGGVTGTREPNKCTPQENSSGQVGNGNVTYPTDPVSTPTPAVGLSDNIIAISAGYKH
jgi:hypothetical protein